MRLMQTGFTVYVVGEKTTPVIPNLPTIILNAGTTALEVAKIIAERNIPVSVLTFSFIFLWWIL